MTHSPKTKSNPFRLLFAVLLLVVLTSVGLKAQWVLLRFHPRCGTSFRAVVPVSWCWRLVRARASCLFFRKPIVVKRQKTFQVLDYILHGFSGLAT